MAVRTCVFLLVALVASATAVPVRFREKFGAREATKVSATPVINVVPPFTKLPDLNEIATKMNSLLTTLLGSAPKTSCASPIPCEAYNVEAITGTKNARKVKLTKVTNLKTLSSKGERDGWGDPTPKSRDEDGGMITARMFSMMAANVETTSFIHPYGQAVGKPNGVMIKVGSAAPEDAVHEVAHCYQTGSDPGQSFSEGPNECLTYWAGAELGGAMKYSLSGTYAPYSWFIIRYLNGKFGFKLIMDFQQNYDGGITPDKFKSLKSVVDKIKRFQFKEAAAIIKDLPAHTPDDNEKKVHAILDKGAQELEANVASVAEGCLSSGEWQKPAEHEKGDKRPAIFCKLYTYQKANPAAQRVKAKVDEWCKLPDNEVAKDDDFIGTCAWAAGA